MNPNCRGYALPSLCFSVLPICRTPEETNHQFFRNKAIAMEELRQRFTEQTTTPATTTAELSTVRAVDKKREDGNSTTGAKLKTNKTLHEKKNNVSRKIKTKKPLTTTQPVLSAESLFTVPTTVFSYPNFTTEILQIPVTVGETSEVDRQKRSFDVSIDAQTKFIKSKHFVQDVENFAYNNNVLQTSLAETEAFKKHYPPTRKTERLRRICRNECELLENELCQKEYAIAKRHPAIGQVLPLEDCHDLPKNTKDCSSLGIAIEEDENERCYWENGAGYRGTVAISQSGKPCLTWARLMKEIANYPELAGQNYCR